MAAITFSGGLTWAGAVRVYTRQRWADAWSLNSRLVAERITWSLWPSVPVASLSFRYGRRTDGGAWSTVTKPNLLGYFVKIEADAADGGLLWVGFIDEQVDQQGGIAGGVAYGKLNLQAYGMAQSLALERVLGSFWWDSIPATPVKRQSGTGITFNSGGVPNRTKAVPTGETSYLFEPDANNADFWSSDDIARYLVAQHLPRATGGSVAIPWTLNTYSLLPTWDRPELPSDNESVFDLLNLLIDRRLFLSACDGYVLASNLNTINVVSLSSTTADLGNGRTLAAAATQHTITFTGDHATTATLQSTASGTYQQVIARGARRTSTVTLEMPAGTTTQKGFERSWTTTEASNYNAGASGESSYVDLDSYARRKLNIAARSKPSLQHVYRNVRIPLTWDFKTRTNAWVFPTDETPANRHFAFFQSIEILPLTQFLAGVDYALWSPPDPPDLTNAKSQRTPPLVVWKRPFVSGAPTRYQAIDGMGETGLISGNNDDAWFSADARIGNDRRSLDIIPDGAPQYAIAGSQFVPLADDTIPVSAWDINTIEATVTLQDDRFTEARSPDNVTTTVDAVRKLVIDCGDAFRRDWVVRYTTVEIDAEGNTNTFFDTGDGAFLRDDKPALQSIAELAALWYLVPRQIMRLISNRITSALNVGDLITAVNPATAQAATVNTTISEISLTLGESENGPPQPPVFELVTTATAFDPLAFLPESPDGDAIQQ